MGTDPADRWSELGAFIREQRSSARLSLRRLSELAGISNPYLSQIERGLRRPSAETLHVQAGILDPPSEVPDLARQILADPHLNEEQKQALVRIYLSFRREHEGAPNGDGATAGPGSGAGSGAQSSPAAGPAAGGVDQPSAAETGGVTVPAGGAGDNGQMTGGAG